MFQLRRSEVQNNGPFDLYCLQRSYHLAIISISSPVDSLDFADSNRDHDVERCCGFGQILSRCRQQIFSRLDHPQSGGLELLHIGMASLSQQGRNTRIESR